jgi:hypothetical protein
LVDVTKIAQYTLLDFFLGVRFTAPTIDLRPAGGDAGLHPVTGKIAIGDLRMESSCAFA